jgi:hypothetical protein
VPIPDTTIRDDRERPTPRDHLPPVPLPSIPVLHPRPAPLPRPSFWGVWPPPPIRLGCVTPRPRYRRAVGPASDTRPVACPPHPAPPRRVPASSRIRFVQAPRRPREREIGVPGLLVLIAVRQSLPAPPDSWCYCAIDRLAWRMLHIYGRALTAWTPRFMSLELHALRSLTEAGRYMGENRTQVTPAPSASRAARAGLAGTP